MPALTNFNDIKKKYNFKEISFATWRDPSLSVHPARGGPSTPTFSYEAAGKPYVPKYKVAYNPVPEPTDDKLSEVEVEGEKADVEPPVDSPPEQQTVEDSQAEQLDNIAADPPPQVDEKIEAPDTVDSVSSGAESSEPLKHDVESSIVEDTMPRTWDVADDSEPEIVTTEPETTKANEVVEPGEDKPSTDVGDDIPPEDGDAPGSSEEQVDERRVSFAPGTPEPKPTLRKKKVPKGTKGKKKRIAVPIDNLPPEVAAMLDGAFAKVEELPPPAPDPPIEEEKPEEDADVPKDAGPDESKDAEVAKADAPEEAKDADAPPEEPLPSETSTDEKQETQAADGEETPKDGAPVESTEAAPPQEDTATSELPPEDVNETVDAVKETNMEDSSAEEEPPAADAPSKEPLIMYEAPKNEALGPVVAAGAPVESAPIEPSPVEPPPAESAPPDSTADASIATDKSSKKKSSKFSKEKDKVKKKSSKSKSRGSPPPPSGLGIDMPPVPELDDVLADVLAAQPPPEESSEQPADAAPIEKVDADAGGKTDDKDDAPAIENQDPAPSAEAKDAPSDDQQPNAPDAAASETPTGAPDDDNGQPEIAPSEAAQKDESPIVDSGESGKIEGENDDATDDTAIESRDVEAAVMTDGHHEEHEEAPPDTASSPADSGVEFEGAGSKAGEEVDAPAPVAEDMAASEAAVEASEVADAKTEHSVADAPPDESEEGEENHAAAEEEAVLEETAADEPESLMQEGGDDSPVNEEEAVLPAEESAPAPEHAEPSASSEDAVGEAPEEPSTAIEAPAAVVEEAKLEEAKSEVLVAEEEPPTAVVVEEEVLVQAEKTIEEPPKEAEPSPEAPPSPVQSKSSSHGSHKHKADHWERNHADNALKKAFEDRKVLQKPHGAKGKVPDEVRVKDRSRRHRRSSLSAEEEEERRRRKEAKKAEEAARLAEEDKKRAEEDEKRRIRHEARKAARKAEAEAEQAALREADSRRRRHREREEHHERERSHKEIKTTLPSITMPSIPKGLKLAAGESVHGTPVVRSHGGAYRPKQSSSPPSTRPRAHTATKEAPKEVPIETPREDETPAAPSSSGDKSHHKHRHHRRRSDAERPSRSSRDGDHDPRSKRTVVEEKQRSFFGLMRAL